LNANGGIIYFGIEDDGVIKGVPLNRSDRDKIRLMISSVRLDPPAVGLFKVKFAKVAQDKQLNSESTRYVVQIHVKKGFPGEIYCTFAGEYFVRQNGFVVQLKGQSLKQYIGEKLSNYSFVMNKVVDLFSPQTNTKSITSLSNPNLLNLDQNGDLIE
jgi:hypothetical protein